MNFEQLAAEQLWFFRLLLGLRSKMKHAGIAVFVVLSSPIVLVALITKSPNLVNSRVMGLTIGIPLGLSALMWFPHGLDRALSSIKDALENTELLEQDTHAYVEGFPRDRFLLPFILIFGALLFHFLGVASGLGWKIYFALLAICGSGIFVYGIVGFVLTARFFNRLCEYALKFFYTHRLVALSTFACELCFYGTLPIIYTSIIYAWTKAVIPLCSLALEILILFTTFLGAEIAIARMISAARDSILDSIAAQISVTWAKIDSIDTAKNQDAYETLDDLHKLRDSIKAYRAGIIDWGAFCGKMVIPIVVALAISLATDIVRHTTQPKPAGDSQPRLQLTRAWKTNSH